MRFGGFGFNKQFGFGAPTPVRSSGGGGQGTFPFAPGTIGFETDWILTGDFSWDAGTSSIRVNGSSGSATLTGAAKTAFDAAISNSTSYDGSLTVAGYVTGGQIGLAGKGGDPGTFEAEGDGPVSSGFFSGTGSGLVFTVVFGTPNWRMTELTLTPS